MHGVMQIAISGFIIQYWMLFRLTSRLHNDNILTVVFLMKTKKNQYF